MSSAPSSAAIHEAGHAVIARKLGLSCGKVTIEPETTVRATKRANGPGYTVTPDRPLPAHAEIGRRFYPKRPAATEQECDQAFAIALYAGAEAERVICGKLEHDDAHDRADAAQVLGLRTEALEAEQPLRAQWLEVQLRAKANELVREHRAAIEWVAIALSQRRTLYPRQVDAVMEIAKAIEEAA